MNNEQKVSVPPSAEVELPPLENREYSSYAEQNDDFLVQRQEQLRAEITSNLLLREENERLRAAKDDAIYFQDRVKEIGFADTDEVKHAKEDLARMREDLATLRASASSETLADAYERGQLLMRDKCAAFYDSRAGDIGIQRYLRPTATNPEKADRSQG